MNVSPDSVYAAVSHLPLLFDTLCVLARANGNAQRTVRILKRAATIVLSDVPRTPAVHSEAHTSGKTKEEEANKESWVADKVVKALIGGSVASAGWAVLMADGGSKMAMPGLDAMDENSLTNTGIVMHPAGRRRTLLEYAGILLEKTGRFLGAKPEAFHDEDGAILPDERWFGSTRDTMIAMSKNLPSVPSTGIADRVQQIGAGLSDTINVQITKRAQAALPEYAKIMAGVSKKQIYLALNSPKSVPAESVTEYKTLFDQGVVRMVHDSQHILRYCQTQQRKVGVMELKLAEQCEAVQTAYGQFPVIRNSQWPQAFQHALSRSTGFDCIDEPNVPSWLFWVIMALVIYLLWAFLKTYKKNVYVRKLKIKMCLGSTDDKLFVAKAHVETLHPKALLDEPLTAADVNAMDRLGWPKEMSQAAINDARRKYGRRAVHKDESDDDEAKDGDDEEETKTADNDEEGAEGTQTLTHRHTHTAGQRAHKFNSLQKNPEIVAAKRTRAFEMLAEHVPNLATRDDKAVIRVYKLRVVRDFESLPEDRKTDTRRYIKEMISHYGRSSTEQKEHRREFADVGIWIVEDEEL